MPNSAIGYTPFLMVHGDEAMLSAEVCYKALRVVTYSKAESMATLEEAVDLLHEARDIVTDRLAVYQRSLRNYHIRWLRPSSFVEGDLVLRLKQKGHLKLSQPGRPLRGH